MYVWQEYIAGDLIHAHQWTHNFCLSLFSFLTVFNALNNLEVASVLDNGDP